MDSLIIKICDASYEFSGLKKHGISLERPEYFDDHKKYTFLKPDIIIKNLQGFAVEAFGPLIRELGRDKSLEGIEEVYDDNWTGTKGKVTEFFVSKDLNEKFKNCPSNDLKMVYELVDQVMD